MEKVFLFLMGILVLHNIFLHMKEMNVLLGVSVRYLMKIRCFSNYPNNYLRRFHDMVKGNSAPYIIALLDMAAKQIQTIDTTDQ